ncbi:MAG TPA: hypothetical protein VF781_11570, partial [Solirubrobacteraceae bacterium]
EGSNEQSPHALRLLNQFSNTDRHTKLPLFAHGVQGIMIKWQFPDGQFRAGVGFPGPGNLLEDQAEIKNVPQGAVHVESYGTPEIVIRTTMKDAQGRTMNVPIVEFVENTLTFIRQEILPELTPHVRVSGKRR